MRPSSPAGTFLGILDQPGLRRARPRCSRWAASPSCARSRSRDGELRIGAMVTHRALERDPRVRERVAGARPRVLARRQPARAQPGHGRRRAGRRRLRLRPAGDARRARGARGPALRRAASARWPIEDLILGYYETCIARRRAARRGPRPAGARPRPSTASSARARARTGRASPSRPRGAADGAARRRRRRGRHAAALPRRRAPLGAARRAAEIGAALRGADRADRRRPRLGRLPPPRHRRRGAPRDRGAARERPRPARHRRAGLLGRRRARPGCCTRPSCARRTRTRA